MPSQRDSQWRSQTWPSPRAMFWFLLQKFAAAWLSFQVWVIGLRFTYAKLSSLTTLRYERCPVDTVKHSHTGHLLHEVHWQNAHPDSFYPWSHEKSWPLWAGSIARSCGVPKLQEGAGEAHSQSGPCLDRVLTSREQGTQRLQQCTDGASTCSLCVNNVQVIFVSGNVKCLEAISTLSGYLIRWKFLQVQPINASIALVMRQSSTSLKDSSTIR